MDQSEPRHNRPIQPVKIIEMAHHNYTGPPFNISPYCIGYTVIDNNMLHPDDARQQGYVIDDTCYPWFAYKGPRFAPTESKGCYTDLESTFIKAASTPLGPADDRYTAEAQTLRNASVSAADIKFVEVVRFLDRGDAARARIATANSMRLDVPPAVQALHFFLTVEMKRVFYNVRGADWNPDFDPEIEGIVWRPKWRGHWRDPHALLPNFEFGDVKLWFAEAGRHTQASSEFSMNEWIIWFERCHKHILQWGEDHKFDSRLDD